MGGGSLRSGGPGHGRGRRLRTAYDDFGGQLVAGFRVLCGPALHAVEAKPCFSSSMHSCSQVRLRV